MKQSCAVGLDYLGLPPEEISVTWDTKVDDTKSACSYFQQVEEDPCRPTKRLRVCGNCIYYVVLEDKKEVE